MDTKTRRLPDDSPVVCNFAARSFGCFR
jgi:hypothetical protein